MEKMKREVNEAWRKWSTEHEAPWSVALLGVSVGNCDEFIEYPFQELDVAIIYHEMKYNIVII